MKIFSLRFGARVSLVSLALVGMAEVAHAQQDEDFYAFDGIPRQQLVLQAGLVNAQVFGAVSAVERVLMPKGYFDKARVGGEFNWMWNVAQVPGCVGSDGDCSGGYRLQTVDMAASNFAASYCLGDQEDDVRACGFYASAMTVTIAAPNGRRFNQNAVYGTIGRAYGPIAPIMLALGGSEYRDGLTAVHTSAVAGVNISSPWLSGRVGYLGAPDNRGLYTDFSADSIHAFITTAFTDELRELNTLLAGVRKLGSDIASAPGTLTAYVRRLKQLPVQTLNRLDDYRMPSSDDASGAFTQLSAHFKPEDMLRMFNLDAAYLFEPTPQLYNLIGSVHTPGYQLRGGADEEDFAFGASVGGGLVSLPELPGYGLRKSDNINFHAEIGMAQEDSFAFKLRFHINDPDYLTQFPFARNAWSLYYYLTVVEGIYPL